jgi:hypothetical protein
VISVYDLIGAAVIAAFIIVVFYICYQVGKYVPYDEDIEDYGEEMLCRKIETSVHAV